MSKRENFLEIDKQSIISWVPLENEHEPPISSRFKKRMNRLFRERLGATDNIPHPEVDNAYERIRSRTIRCFFVMSRKIKKHSQKLFK